MKLSEVYLSIQGEGPRVGIPTIFVRFAGCNLRCPGWPCDTPHAIFPDKYRNEWLKISPRELYDVIKSAVGNRRSVNICYTGGEPFLQSSEELRTLTNLLTEDEQIGAIECFSNGSLRYPEWALDAIYFVLDWKLEGSGEDHFNPARLENLKRLSNFDSVKFTIASEDDYDQAKEAYNWLLANCAAASGEVPLDIFYGVVWGKVENSDLIEWVLRDKLPWRHTMQVHNIIWDRNKRGI